MRISLGIASLCAPLALAGCDDGREPVVCTAIAVPSLVVTVRDAATARPICDANVTALQQGTTYVLAAFPEGGGCTYSGPWEQSGAFDVLVSRPGYQQAAVRGVRVTADECHVSPARVTIELQPEG